jgi:hypothetical protein
MADPNVEALFIVRRMRWFLALIWITQVVSCFAAFDSEAEAELACVPAFCADNGHPEGEVVWKNSRTGERHISACAPSNWWPFASFTCLVDDEPIHELQHDAFAGLGSGWIGASLRQPGDLMILAIPVVRSSLVVSVYDAVVAAGLDHEMVSSSSHAPERCYWTSKQRHPPILYVYDQPRELYPNPLVHEIKNVRLANQARFGVRCEAGGKSSPWVLSAWTYFGPERDMTGDGKMTVEDLWALKASWLRRAGDPLFDPAADLNEDGGVGMIDLALLRSAYGRLLWRGRWVLVP